MLKNESLPGYEVVKAGGVEVMLDSVADLLYLPVGHLGHVDDLLTAVRQLEMNCCHD